MTIREERQDRITKELYEFECKLGTSEQRAEMLRLLQYARERLSKLQGYDLRLTRFEHCLLEDAIRTLNKVLQ